MPAAPPLQYSSCPLTREVVREQLRQCVGTVWRPGDRIPPIRQIARELGFGESSTFAAVRDLVEAGVLASRPRRGTFVTATLPEPMRPPRPLLNSKRIEILSFGVEPDGFVVRMLEHFEATLRAGSPASALGRAVIPYEALGSLGERDADALVLVNPNPSPDIVFGPNQVLVVINTALETPVAMPGRFDVVSVDQEQGGFLAGRRLREIGCRSACFIGRSGSRTLATMDQTCVMRLRGFERGWGASLPTDRIIVAKSYDPLSAARELPKWLAMSPRPDGIFAATDELALGAIFGASAHGLAPGRDFQIVGFDGQQCGRDLHDHPLTTVDVPVQDMGRRGAELLMSRLASPDRPVRRLALGCSMFDGSTARSME